MSETVLRGLPETIDHLLCVEFRRSGIHDGVIDPLYRAAREVAGAPLAWTAAEDLLDRAGPKQSVIIATGHVHPMALPVGETDGPPGAVALARAILETTAAAPILITESVVVPILMAACNAAGLVVRARDQLPQPRSVAIEAFPVDADEADRATIGLLEGACAVVTVEKIGRCAGGGYRTGSGTDVEPHLAKVDRLVDEARSRGVLTIGIGDLGNEIGMARIARAVVRLVKRGDIIASTVETDHLLVAACSNWGAYGLAAAMAAQTNTPAALHTGDLEARLIEACCQAGAVDGFSTGPTREVDGAGIRTHAAFVDLLGDVVRIGLDRRIPERHRIEGTAS